jgi:hypothetical protein
MSTKKLKVKNSPSVIFIPLWWQIEMTSLIGSIFSYFLTKDKRAPTSFYCKTRNTTCTFDIPENLKDGEIKTIVCNLCQKHSYNFSKCSYCEKTVFLKRKKYNQPSCDNHTNDYFGKCQTCQKLYVLPPHQTGYMNIVYELKCRLCQSLVKCTRCSKNIYTLTERGNQLSYLGDRTQTCHDCYTVISKLWSRSADNCYPDYSVTITYDKNLDNHDGYCSDPQNLTTEITQINETYPLTQLIKLNEIDEDNEIEVSLLNKFYPKMTEGCQNGSNYCGCGTTYSIRSGRVCNLNETKKG